jgi:hypothetical protein
MKNPKDLSDDELVARLMAGHAELERHREAKLREVLELERQGVHQQLGYASVLEMCVRHLGMDEDEIREDLERMASSRETPRAPDSQVRVARLKDPPRAPRKGVTPIRSRRH